MKTFKLAVADDEGRQVAEYGLPVPEQSTLDGTEDLYNAVRMLHKPYAGELYEATLHGFDETGGDVESPSGWFALVEWPNGVTYLITNDVVGNVRISDSAAKADTAGQVRVHGEYQSLIGQYDAWTDVAEGEM